MLLFLPDPAEARQAEDTSLTPRAHPGGCTLWTAPPGTFEREGWGYSLCALDRPPELLEESPMPPAPRFSVYGGGSLTVLVTPAGTVDSVFTRYTGMTSRFWKLDREFNAAMLATVRRWRFRPGTRNGQPVRVAIRLRVDTDIGPDTLPGTLAWTYEQNLAGAVLVGRWTTDAPLSPFPEAIEDSIRVASLRALAEQDVFVAPARYCLLLPSQDRGPVDTTLTNSETPVRRVHWLMDRLEAVANADRPDDEAAVETDAREGCERYPGSLRLVFGTVHRVGEDRAVLYLDGDDLERWPRGSEGAQRWRAWRARCVAVRTQDGWYADCPYFPDFSLESMARTEH